MTECEDLSTTEWASADLFEISVGLFEISAGVFEISAELPLIDPVILFSGTLLSVRATVEDFD